MHDGDMQSAIATSSINVLIVDDDPVFLALAEAVLLDAGCGRVETAESGEAGTRSALAANPPPDLILLDLNIPDFDGLAAMRLLADIEFKGAVVIVSGEKPAVLQAAATLAGLHGLHLAGVLSKPLKPEELSAIMAGLPKQSMRANPAPADAKIERSPGKMSRLVPAYQPKIRLADRRIYGAEALMRVLLDDGRIAAPLDYLSSLTDMSELGEVTLSFLAMILMDMRSWAAPRLRPISVNVPAQLLEEGRYMERFAEAVRAAKVIPAQITIEMTEAALPKDMSKLVEVMTRLRMAGFGLAIDDYGTGMANYDILRLCPFTELKIDRSVVQAAT